MLLSAWITEAARAAVLSGRGHNDAAVRAQARARLLASACAREGVGIVPRFASAHAEWMAEVAGPPEETGALGWFLLQRLGMFVDAHVGLDLPAEEHARLKELGAPDLEEVNAAIAAHGMPATPPAEWPEAEPAVGDGQVRARIGVIGDPHIGLARSNTMIPAVLKALAGEGVDLAVAIGDMTQDGREDYFVQAGEIFGAAPFPIRMTLGNHDMWGVGTRSEDGEPNGPRWFRQHLGMEPSSVTEIAGVTAIVLNSADPTPSPFPPFDLFSGSFTDGPKESVTRGSFDDETLAFMSEVEVDGPSVIFLHHPPYPYLGLPPLAFGLTAEATEALSEFAARVGAVAIFCGHTHRNARYMLDGTPFIEVPSSKEWPFGYGLIEVTDRSLTYNLRPIPEPDLVAHASADAGILFRRYARGPAEARSFTIPL